MFLLDIASNCAIHSYSTVSLFLIGLVTSSPSTLHLILLLCSKENRNASIPAQTLQQTPVVQQNTVMSLLCDSLAYNTIPNLVYYFFRWKQTLLLYDVTLVKDMWRVYYSPNDILYITECIKLLILIIMGYFIETLHSKYTTLNNQEAQRQWIQHVKVNLKTALYFY